MSTWNNVYLRPKQVGLDDIIKYTETYDFVVIFHDKEQERFKNYFEKRPNPQNLLPGLYHIKDGNSYNIKDFNYLITNDLVSSY